MGCERIFYEMGVRPGEREIITVHNDNEEEVTLHYARRVPSESRGIDTLERPERPTHGVVIYHGDVFAYEHRFDQRVSEREIRQKIIDLSKDWRKSPRSLEEISADVEATANNLR